MNDWQQRDFPAAHSMDASWWGVDAQGHVAQFETGEAGALPRDAQPRDEELINAILQHCAVDTPLDFFADDLMDQTDGKMYARRYGTPWNVVERLHPDECRAPFGYLLWIKDEAALQRVRDASDNLAAFLLQRPRHLFQRGVSDDSRTLARIPCRQRILGWIDRFQVGDSSEGTLKKLLFRGDLLRVWKYGRPLEIERFGFFNYCHDSFDNWVCGPLERGAPPRRPVKRTDLPPELAEQVAAFTAPFDFMREAIYQPFEHGPAGAWSADWVSTLGEQHIGEAPPRRQAILPPNAHFQGKSELTALLAACLFGQGGTPKVVNDYLQEQGLPPLAIVGGPERRLEEILHTLFTPEERLAFEIDCLAQAIALADLPSEDTRQLGEWLNVARGFLRSERTDEDLRNAARLALDAWSETYEPVEGEEESGVGGSPAPPKPPFPRAVQQLRWGAMALLRRWPLVAARAARSLDDELLAWQIEHALALLDARHG